MRPQRATTSPGNNSTSFLETCIMEGDDCHDLLWKAVAQNQINKFPSTADHWKHQNDNSVCEFCTKSDDGVKLRCFNDKCKVEYHLECAKEAGIIVLNDDGQLELHCRNHFKAILFCSCRKPYNENDNMICCDDCIEWYHIGCLGLNKKEADQLSSDRYSCPHCVSIKRNGLSVKKSVKERNEDKERRSSCQQAATSVINYLDLISQDPCTIMDLIFDHPSTKNDNIKVPKDCLRSAITLLSISGSDYQGTERESLIRDNVKKLGLDLMLDGWKEKMIELDQLSDNFLVSAGKIYGELVGGIETPSLKNIAIQTFLETIHSAMNELRQTQPSVAIEEIDNYYLIFDSVKFLLEVFEEFNNPKQSDNWIADIFTHIRNFGPTFRKIAALGKDPEFKQVDFAWYDILQTFVNLFTHETTVMKNWMDLYTMTCKHRLSYTDAKKLLEKASGFYCDLPQVRWLNEQVQASDNFEERLLQVFENNTLCNDIIEQLSNESQNLPMTPKIQLLDLLYDLQQLRLKCEGIISGDSRVRLEIIQDLKAQIGKIRNETINVDLPKPINWLLETLGKLEVGLDHLLLDASEISQKWIQKLSQFNYDVITSNDELKSSKVITKEEQIVDFLQKSDMLQSLWKDVTAGNKVYSIEEFKTLFEDDIEPFLHSINTEVLPTNLFQGNQSSILEDHRARLETMKLDIAEELLKSQEYFEVVSKYLAEFTNNVNCSTETFSGAVEKARSSFFSNPEVLNEADAILEKGKELSAEIEQFLSKEYTNDIIEFEILEEFERKIFCFPIESSLFKKMERRSRVCKIVRECESMMSSISRNENNQIFGENITGLDLGKMKETHQTLDRYTVQMLDSYETRLITSVKSRYVAIHCRCECIFALRHKATISNAESILDHFSKNIEVAGSYSEFTTLQQELQSAYNLRKDLNEIMNLFVNTINETKQTKFIALGFMSNASLISLSNNFKSFNVDKTQYEKSKQICSYYLEKFGAIVPQVHRLSNDEKSLKLSCVEESKRLNSLFSFYDLFQRANSLHQTIFEQLMKISDEYNQNNPIINHKFHRENRDRLYDLARRKTEIIDINSLFNLVSQLRNESMNLCSDNCVTNLLVSQMQELLTISNSWNDTYSTYVPHKNTRMKSVPKSHRVEELEMVLDFPIARVISNSLHDRIRNALSQVDSIRAELLNLILNSTTNNNNINNNNDCKRSDDSMETDDDCAIVVVSAEIKADIDNNKSIESLASDVDIYNERKQLYDMIPKLDVIPLDLIETHILVWYTEVLEWVQEYARIVNNVSSNSIISNISSNNNSGNEILQKYTFENVHQKIEMTENRIVSFPQMIFEELLRVDIIEKNPEFDGKKSVMEYQFCKGVSSNLKTATKFYLDLKQQCKNTMSFQEKVEQVIMKSSANGNESELQQLISEYETLRVEPLLKAMRNIYKFFDKNISNYYNQAVIASGGTMPSSTSSSSLTIPSLTSLKSTHYWNDNQESLPMSRPFQMSSIDPLFKRKRPLLLQQQSPSSSGSTSNDQLPFAKIARDINSEIRDCRSVSQLSELKYKSMIKGKLLRCCASINCRKPLKDITAVYCSGVCAVNSSQESFEALLTYRRILSKESFMSFEEHMEEFDSRITSKSDRMAFQQSDATSEECMERYLSMSKALGLLEKQKITKENENGKKYELVLVSEKEKEFQANSNSTSGNSSDMSDLSRFLQSLPNASMSLLMSCDATSTTTNNRSVTSASTPALSPSVSNDIESTRSTMRNGLETLVLSILVMYGIRGAISISAIVAIEFEDALFKKYNNNPKKEFAKLDYRSHFVTLRSNLKRTHNHKHVLDLISGELSYDKLLSFKVQDFADNSLKQERAKMKIEFLRNSEKIREDVDVVPVDNSLISAKDAEKNLNPKFTMNIGETFEETSNSSNNNSNVTIVEDNDGSNASLISSPTSSLSSGSPRSKSISSNSMVFSDNSNDFKSEFDTSKDSFFNIDQLIKQSESQPIIPDKRQFHEEESNDISTLEPSSLSSSLSSSSSYSGSNSDELSPFPWRLICSDGSMEFQLNKPQLSPMTMRGSIKDKRVQGLLNSSMNIDGRTKIRELEDFLIQCVSIGRKIIAVTKLYVTNNANSELGYSKFCEEFTNDMRSGICNVKNGPSGNKVEFYIVPPQLKNHITILRSIDSSSNSNSNYKNILYGIIISKVPGPSELVNATQPYENDDLKSSSYSHSYSPERKHLDEKEEVPGNVSPDALETTRNIINTAAPQGSIALGSVAGIPRPLQPPTARTGLALPRGIAPGGLPRPGTLGGVPPTATSGINAPMMNPGLQMPRGGVLPRGPLQMPSTTPGTASAPGHGYGHGPSPLPMSMPMSMPNAPINQRNLMMPRPLGVPQQPQQQQQQYSSVPNHHHHTPVPNYSSNTNPNASNPMMNHPMNMPPRGGAGLPRPGFTNNPAGMRQLPLPKINFMQQSPNEQQILMTKLAEYCVNNGVQSMEELKMQEGAMYSTPFLFETHALHDEFMEMLRYLVAKRSNKL